MKIVYYCQHVLGVGHFLRSVEICKALDTHDVLLVTGGLEIKIQLPSHIRTLFLPGIMMDPEFKSFLLVEKNKSIDQVKQVRRELLIETFKKEAPDIFIVELYPFGRKAFRFELDPILDGIRNKDLSPSCVICSLRDILVEKKDTVSYENRVVNILNTCFDAVLVHADPSLIKLDETFSRTDEIVIPMVYTGFVTPKPPPDARAKIRQRHRIAENEILVVASAGGGKVGFRLLQAVVQVLQYMEAERSIHLYIFSGPLMSNEDFDRLKSFSNRRIQVSRFNPDFLSYLAAADLSVSMAGYNTCTNILAARVPSLVWPFSQNREQRLRAETLARLGALEILNEDDLQPPRLASIMEASLYRQSQSRINIDLDGAINTAQWLESWIENSHQK